MEEHSTFTFLCCSFCMPAFTKPFIKSFLSFSSLTSLIALSPLVPLPGKLNHSFSVCSLSSTPLYAHRLAPSLMTFPRRFSEDIERGGRKRAFLSNKRKGDLKNVKSSHSGQFRGAGSGHILRREEGLLLSGGWARDPGQGPGAMQRLLR